MSPAEWSAARKSELEASVTGEPGMASPVTYRGTDFRSTLEANWAATLDHYGIEWQYEPWVYRAPSGERYLPDFWLPAVSTFIEVKGAHMHRAHKPQQLAEGVRTDNVIVLLGFDAASVSHSPYSFALKLQWRDPLGYDTRLAQCPRCSGWQWMRAQLSRNCRLCGAFHSGLLARSGEMPFSRATPSLPAWLVGSLCPGSVSTTLSIATRRSLRLGMRQSAYSSAVAHTARSI
jgi:hypothetical protein